MVVSPPSSFRADKFPNFITILLLWFFASAVLLPLGWACCCCDCCCCCNQQQQQLGVDLGNGTVIPLPNTGTGTGNGCCCDCCCCGNNNNNMDQLAIGGATAATFAIGQSPGAPPIRVIQMPRGRRRRQLSELLRAQRATLLPLATASCPCTQCCAGGKCVKCAEGQQCVGGKCVQKQQGQGGQRASRMYGFWQRKERGTNE